MFSWGIPRNIIINHTAGTFLLLMVIVTVLLLWWRKTLIQDRKTFMSIGWAFCFGMVLILGFLTWFAIWIAGSYYGVRIVKTIRVNNQYDDNNNGICPMSIIVITFISVISVWIIGIGICITLVVRLFCSTVQDGISSEFDGKGKQTVGWKKKLINISLINKKPSKMKNCKHIIKYILL